MLLIDHVSFVFTRLGWIMLGWDELEQAVRTGIDYCRLQRPEKNQRGLGHMGADYGGCCWLRADWDGLIWVRMCQVPLGGD